MCFVGNALHRTGQRAFCYLVLHECQCSVVGSDSHQKTWVPAVNCPRSIPCGAVNILFAAVQEDNAREARNKLNGLQQESDKLAEEKEKLRAKLSKVGAERLASLANSWAQVQISAAAVGA